MVSYYSAGTQWATKKGNPKKVDPDNACGMKIAVQKATVQVDDITARSQKCTAAGKPAITIDQYDGAGRRHRGRRLRQGRRQARRLPGHGLRGRADQGPARAARRHLRLRARTATSSPRTRRTFAQAIADAVKSLIDDGTYKKVLEKWGVEAGAIDDPTVNPTVG